MNLLPPLYQKLAKKPVLQGYKMHCGEVTSHLSLHLFDYRIEMQ